MEAVPIALLKEFSAFITSRLGIQFKDDNLANLQNKLKPLAKELGYATLEECFKSILDSPTSERLTNRIAYYVTVGETYFFRDKDAFHLLENTILPQLIQEHRLDKKITIWSCACCTGEEVYSIAILLSRLVTDIEGWSVRLIGTDINLEFLDKARKAVYSKWSLRGMNDTVKDHYFTTADGLRYALKPSIRKLPAFFALNLIEDMPSEMEKRIIPCDIILACNVLYYFPHEQVQQVVDRLQKYLAPQGILIVSPVEVPLIHHPALIEERFGTTTVFRKTTQAPVEVEKQQREKKERKEAKQHLTPSTGSPNHHDKPAVTENSDKLSQEVLHMGGKGEKTEALSKIQDALKTDPLNPALYYLLGTIYIDLGENSLAIKAFEKTLFLDSSNITAYFLLGNLLAGEGDVEEARIKWNAAEKILSGLSSEVILAHTDGIKVGEMRLLIKSALKR